MPPAAVLAVDPEHIHPITAEAYLGLAAADPPAWEATELVRGVIYDVSPEHRPHANAVWEIRRKLEAAFPEDRVFTSGSIQSGPVGVPMPDVFVVKAGTDLGVDAPFDADEVKLVVEVAASTRARDLQAKPFDYAAGGIPEYWVLDLGRNVLVRHTEPSDDGYLHVRTYPLPDGVAGLPIDDLVG